MEALEWGLFAAGKKAEKTQSDKSDKSAVKSGKVKSALIDSSVNWEDKMNNRDSVHYMLV